jgi:Collagen triple helix repeat (20 copies)
MNSTRRHLSYANVVATLALVFAMSGGALAASHYIIAKTSQIKPSVLKALKGRNGKTGPTGPQGTAGANGAVGKEGPQGKEGSKGQQGTEGPSGISGYQIVQGNVASGSGSGFNFAFSKAKCPSGKKVIGGGYYTLSGENGKIYADINGPVGTEEWEAVLSSASLSAYTQSAYAICATVSS